MIKIRNARTEDLPQLIKLFGGVKEIADFEGQKHDKNYFMQFMKSKECGVFVAVNGTDVCGAIITEINDLANYVYINNIVVSKECRGKGIGRILMRHIEDICRKKKIARIIALVYDWNTNMQSVMEHYNYEATGKTIVYSKKVNL
jgi:ribosomal protein S18 acetylase RimI-like enzyme